MECDEEEQPVETKQGVWDEQKQPLKEDEELEFDNEAYQMLHRAQVEWPCLSLDVLIKDRVSFPNTSSASSWFPSQMNGVLPAGETIFDKRL